MTSTGAPPLSYQTLLFSIPPWPSINLTPRPQLILLTVACLLHAGYISIPFFPFEVM
jgi:hypothetical protein